MFFTAKLQGWNNRPSGVYRRNMFLEVPWALSSAPSCWLTAHSALLITGEGPCHGTFPGCPKGRSHLSPTLPTPLMEPPGHRLVPGDFWSILNFGHTYPIPSTVLVHLPDAVFQWGLLGRSLAITKCLYPSLLSAPRLCGGGLAQRQWIQAEDSAPPWVLPDPHPAWAGWTWKNYEL